MQRTLACLLLLLVPLGAAACSDDDDSASESDETSETTETTASATPAGEDLEAYCDAVQAGFDLYQENSDVTTPSDSLVDAFLDSFQTALATAPAEIVPAYQAVMEDNDPDGEAQSEIDEFNQEECGVEPIDPAAIAG